MKPLFVLLITFVLLVGFNRYLEAEENHIFAGNIAMGVMLLFTAMGHFKFKTSMAAMGSVVYPQKSRNYCIYWYFRNPFSHWPGYSGYPLSGWNCINSISAGHFTC